MFLGTDINAVDAFWRVCDDRYGLNCSTGPDFMRGTIRMSKPAEQSAEFL
jgi:methionine synthase I (cobalamin-dependent)